MQVAKDSVVSLHYTLHADDGLKIESSRDGGEPVHILIGHGGIIPGLEKALIGHAAGDQFQVDVEPQEAYGERQEDNIQRVPKKYFKEAARLRPGMTATLSMKDGGQRSVTVRKIGSSVVDVDLNHPLAGHKLRFDVEITAVREATAEEISHRHVHGPGGVQHD
ncbi:FKBP-type peptidyl-prolyl cis-trans isomerase [Dokdonella sp.]|uniref:FKBP-type peptidyl-prolyl cis-trans isomerase n=1 Tax=Dokdonella sp. TaxID=2291710 RepID=UPI003C48BBE1